MDIISRSDALKQGLSQFYTGKSCRYGHVSPRSVFGHNCIECRRIALARRYQVHKTEIQKQTRDWFHDNPEKRLLIGARNRAKTRNLEFNLELSDIIIPKLCPVLGIELTVGIGKLSANSPSLDRINSSRGYTKDNVIVISYRANSLKKDATIEEMVAIATFYSSL